MAPCSQHRAIPARMATPAGCGCGTNHAIQGLRDGSVRRATRPATAAVSVRSGSTASAPASRNSAAVARPLGTPRAAPPAAHPGGGAPPAAPGDRPPPADPGRVHVPGRVRDVYGHVLAEGQLVLVRGSLPGHPGQGALGV